MPIYLFKCGLCQEIIEDLQNMDDEHVALCPKCGQHATRVFTTPEAKLNTGFYSDTLGCEVSSQTDFEEKLQRHRFENGLCKYLGDNKTPKGEWVDTVEKADQDKLRGRHDADCQREDAQGDFYDTIESYE